MCGRLNRARRCFLRAASVSERCGGRAEADRFLSVAARREICVAIVTVLVIVPDLLACGPYFENRLLTRPDQQLLTAPIGIFVEEVGRLPIPRVPSVAHVDNVDRFFSDEGQTAAADQADLRAALLALEMDEPRRGALLEQYQNLRQPPRADLASFDCPADLPLEFALYARGASAFHRGRMDEATRHWRALLGLPASQRRYKSTWAAFMLGKVAMGDDGDAAIVWFQRTRELAAEGFGDSLCLAASSYGWEARVHYLRGEYRRAAELYLIQNAAGDRMALCSLRDVAARIVRSDRARMSDYARDPVLRDLITAYMISRGAWYVGYIGSPAVPEDAVRAWLAAVESVPDASLASADRLAWLAYQEGQMDLAERWIARAPADAPVALWIKSKLLLRQGQIDEAAAALSRAMQLFPKADDRDEYMGYEDFVAPSPSKTRATGELAVLRLTRGQYVEAMDLFLQSDYWSDAAYVAEVVLTCEELQRYVDADDNCAMALRELLGRRLARLGRYEQGARYLSTYGGTLRDYAQLLKAGRDVRQEPAARAQALWSAAVIARKDGMELFGSETAPDWHMHDGMFEEGAYLEERRQCAPTTLAATADELARAGRHDLSGKPRFHYRYTAADLAWEAAALMPDEDNQTAYVLWSGGSWLKARDPKAADRFYKALVRRCGTTSLGRRADALRWFPPDADAPPTGPVASLQYSMQRSVRLATATPSRRNMAIVSVAAAGLALVAWIVFGIRRWRRHSRSY
mgnify:CR=1 FL=1